MYTHMLISYMLEKKLFYVEGMKDVNQSSGGKG